ncbi:MAG: hypothetical protein LBO80_12075 [Treponema sp.]|jgi:hypothetical protein|nr:hypothetical protein [Treponema sp.]
MALTQMFPAFVLVSIVMVVLLTELVKRLDGRNRLKGYRVYVPLLFSAGVSWLLRIGEFFPANQVWFWWAVIFSVSVFFFEAILKRVSQAVDGRSGRP